MEILVGAVICFAVAFWVWRRVRSKRETEYPSSGEWVLPDRTPEEVDARTREARRARMAQGEQPRSRAADTAPAHKPNQRIQIRVAAKTSFAWRTLTISPGRGKIACDCDGFDGRICSHIDAVLLCGETHMVHADDRDLVPEARLMATGRITVPDTWRAAWKRERVWRGLEPAERPPVQRKSEKPLVCFTGTLPKSRAHMIAEAKAHGWDVVNSPSRFTDVLVTASPNSTSAKTMAAKQFGTRIVSPSQWENVMLTGELD